MFKNLKQKTGAALKPSPVVLIDSSDSYKKTGGHSNLPIIPRNVYVFRKRVHLFFALGIFPRLYS
jgi:hypothetical protein